MYSFVWRYVFIFTKSVEPAWRNTALCCILSVSTLFAKVLLCGFPKYQGLKLSYVFTWIWLIYNYPIHLIYGHFFPIHKNKYTFEYIYLWYWIEIYLVLFRISMYWGIPFWKSIWTLYGVTYVTCLDWAKTWTSKSVFRICKVHSLYLPKIELVYLSQTAMILSLFSSICHLLNFKTDSPLYNLYFRMATLKL